MTSPKSYKEKITEAVLQEIPEPHSSLYRELPISRIIFLWWYTGRQNGLRLTDDGVTAFELAHIEFYDINFQVKNISYATFLLELNKKIKCPYYIGVNKNDKAKVFYIRLYDSKIALMLNLYGDLQEYLGSIKIKE